MAHVFISYEKTDNGVAKTICQYLEEHGIQCWMAPRNLLAGKEWDVSIIEAIEQASCMVLIFSSQADNSRQVKREVTIADNHEVPIIPCRIKNDEPAKLRYYLTIAHWLDAFEPPLQNHLPNLLKTITAYLPEEQITPPVGEPRPIKPSPAKPQSTAKIKTQPGKEFTNSLGMKFVLIPAGTFMMGSPVSETGRSNKEKQHQVTISQPFYLQTTPVTQGEWQKVMGNNPSYFKDCGQDCPVEEVSWNDAQKFLTKLNQMEKADKYRLPTEAEWEYACRAGSTTRFCFGNEEAKLEEYAWYNTNIGYQTRPVGKKKPNAWGLYDMHGNVLEWCQDLYGDYPAGTVIDPMGPPSGNRRVLRGGAYSLNARDARSADRSGNGPQNCYHNIGFRVARAL